MGGRYTATTQGFSSWGGVAERILLCTYQGRGATFGPTSTSCVMCKRPRLARVAEDTRTLEPEAGEASYRQPYPMKKDAQPSQTNTRLINDAECSNTLTPILLALGILSNPHKGATRAYIRDSMTAANPPGEERVVHRFVIAGQGADFLGLNREGKAHGDLLILDKVSEGSESLSEKSLRWFMYAARSIPCARYVAKTDPDTFIVWPKMRMQLGRMTSGHLSPRLYFGVHCDWTWMLPQVRPHDVDPAQPL